MQLLMEQINAFGQIIGQLQAQVNTLSSRTTTPVLTPNETENQDSMMTTSTKSEKLPDPPMFDGDRKELRPFVTKLRMKLHDNADRFPTDTNRVNYAMSRLEGDAARTMDPFYRNGTFSSVEVFISLLERTYDDASRKHSAATKLEGLKQRNREFTSFYSEFLGLVGELEWNEAAKVDALRRKVSDEVRAQLIGRELPSALPEFATLCQRIDEDIRFAQNARSRRTATTRPTTTTPPTRISTMKPSPTAGDPMDIDSARSYAPAGSDERKDRVSKGLCFGCGLKGHRHKDCPTNPYSKIRQAAATNLSENARSAPKKTYAASIAGSEASRKPVTPIRVATPRITSLSDSENESS